MSGVNKVMLDMEKYFKELRCDESHHLGKGDIRLTMAQQLEIVNAFKEKTTRTNSNANDGYAKLPARNTDPITSKEAGKYIIPHINRLEALVVEKITNSKEGLTTIEIAEIANVDRVTISPRIKPLCAKGLLKDSGKKRGRSIVWALNY